MKTVYSETLGPKVIEHIVKDCSEKIIRGKDWMHEHKEMCPELLKHLFHFCNTKDNPSDVHETIDHILERLEEILFLSTYGKIRTLGTQDRIWRKGALCHDV